MNVVIYARVSSQGGKQSTTRQVKDLKKFCEKKGYTICSIFEEHISGKKNNRERKVLQECISYCKDKRVDTLMITEISRLGRTTVEVLKSLEVFNENKINVYIQNIGIDTLLPDKKVSPIASIICTILAEMASIEWQGIVDRLQSGRKQHIENGGKVGRKVGSVKTDEQMKEEYREVIKKLNKNYSIRAVAQLTGVSPSTVQRVKNKFCKKE